MLQCSEYQQVHSSEWTLVHTDTNPPIRVKSITHLFFHHNFDQRMRAPTNTQALDSRGRFVTCLQHVALCSVSIINS